MSGTLFSPSPQSPHHLLNSRMHTAPMSSSASQQNQTSGNTRKRKADDDEYREDSRMSLSPSSSPNISSQPLPQQLHHTHTRTIKRHRTSVVGRPLTLPRLLETLDVDQLRDVLKNICDQNPQIGAEVVKSAPRPTVASALSVLKRYEDRLIEAFPYSEDSHRTSDYAFNRVRPQQAALLDALADFTPHFLPPNETQPVISLQFLDGATDVIHRLPDWTNYQNSILKTNAYEEIGKAWVLVIKEASKRAGGIQIKYDGWDKKVLAHNEQSGGKLQAVVSELRNTLGWAAGQTPEQTATGARSEEVAQIRQELFSGTYGSHFPVRVGPW